ncbi:MAG: 2-dehydro-3-deoxygalactonokinase [Rhodoferax sp.]|nr:2-dehydro-3-deoxygalactonokinase [Rhodoferax sp.]
MAVHSEIVRVGVDWGTTHRRAYALDALGRCVAEHADDQGALACKGRFAESLQALLHTLRAQPQSVILSGMVGSALGWQVVPYVDGSVALPALGQHLMRVDAALAPTANGGSAVAPWVGIVPGYCVRNAAGQPDVMRGEETQLLGAYCLGHADGWFVLPGTHSKWVELRGGQVAQLRTYMTGELFDLLGHHGTLAAAAGTADAPWDATSFAQGVQSAQSGAALSHQLFGCRARVVSGDMPAASSRAYLSGLLIGAELQDVLHGPAGGAQTTSFKLIGAPALAQHYATAAVLLNLQLELLDARAAFIAAIHFLNPQRTPA